MLKGKGKLHQIEVKRIKIASDGLISCEIFQKAPYIVLKYFIDGYLLMLRFAFIM